MNEENQDPEDDTARLAQEATNQSTPEKSLDEQGAAPQKQTRPPSDTTAKAATGKPLKSN